METLAILSILTGLSSLDYKGEGLCEIPAVAIVRQGDTLGGIAKEIYGRRDLYHVIAYFNNLKNPHQIYPRQELILPAAYETVPCALAKNGNDKNYSSLN